MPKLFIFNFNFGIVNLLYITLSNTKRKNVIIQVKNLIPHKTLWEREEKCLISNVPVFFFFFFEN